MGHLDDDLIIDAVESFDRAASSPTAREHLYDHLIRQGWTPPGGHDRRDPAVVLDLTLTSAFSDVGRRHALLLE